MTATVGDLVPSSSAPSRWAFMAVQFPDGHLEYGRADRATGAPHWVLTLDEEWWEDPLYGTKGTGGFPEVIVEAAALVDGGRTWDSMAIPGTLDLAGRFPPVNPVPGLPDWWPQEYLP